MSTVPPIEKERAPRNRTITLDDEQRTRLRSRLCTLDTRHAAVDPPEGVICADVSAVLPRMPLRFVDLLFLDPPYNLDKVFNGRKFSRTTRDEYSNWLDTIIGSLMPVLKPTATVYICGDWLTSHSIFEAASRHLIVRNRITWEREKGRGAKSNWKNTSEDIWFCTVSEDYFFDVNAVKLRRRVLAPYTREDGDPKDWQRSDNGNYRDTHPSNLWTDISIPFWSMPENTDHPTQKSEKLLAKLLLASTRPGNFVLDPFLGSGTTAVVAKKLGRRCLGIEIDEEFCLLALKRLELASLNPKIQGYVDGVFWERNSLAMQGQVRPDRSVAESSPATLF